MIPGPGHLPTTWAPRLASLLHEIRPDWDEPGTLSALHKLDDRPLALVALAAITAAIERTDQRTPAVIALDGRHWHTLDAVPEQRGNEVAQLLCEHGNRPARCEKCTTRPSAAPTDEQRAQIRAALDAARDAMKARETK